MPDLLPLSVRKPLEGKDERKGFEINQAEDGYTLIEVLASVTIFSILLIAVCNLFVLQMNFLGNTADRLDLQQNVRLAAEYLTRELRYAEIVQLTNEKEVAYMLPDNPALYTIRQKNREIVLVQNTTENKIAYNIEALDISWDEAARVITFIVEGRSGTYAYALRSAVYLPNI